jgi:hypothetical protein
MSEEKKGVGSAGTSLLPIRLCDLRALCGEEANLPATAGAYGLGKTT